MACYYRLHKLNSLPSLTVLLQSAREQHLLEIFCIKNPFRYLKEDFPFVSYTPSFEIPAFGALIYSHYREYPLRVGKGMAKEYGLIFSQKDGDIPSNLLEGLRFKTENRQNRWTSKPVKLVLTSFGSFAILPSANPCTLGYKTSKK